MAEERALASNGSSRQVMTMRLSSASSLSGMSADSLIFSSAFLSAVAAALWKREKERASEKC